VVQEDLNAKVLGIEEVADHRKCFTIERPAGFDFEAGQHMYVETRPDWGAPFTIVYRFRPLRRVHPRRG